jgi:hypothetical protein
MRPWIVSLAVLIACGDNGIAPAPGDRPDAPDGNDPAFHVDGVGPWFLVGNALTPGGDTMSIAVTAANPVDVVDVWVADLPPVRLARGDDGTFTADIAIAALEPGAYDVLLSADGAATAFAQLPFYRSHPYYVMVSTDYDFSDPGDIAIADMDMLHASHPGMRISHFWAPYTYTDPAVTVDRQQQLTAWILGEQTKYHDEIGLHIHPYCNFVVDAGLTCITDQSTVFPEGDTSGYTILLAAYGHDNMNILLDHAASLFEARGLGTPDVFRAGGWTATEDTLAALADHRYIADSSALNWARIEEWKGHLLYDWTMEHWATIGDTSQPYRPSESDILVNTVPQLPLLEVPDNGVMIDYVTLSEMTGIFDANWNGAPLDTPTALMMGFHPSMQFSRAEAGRVDEFLAYADKHLADGNLGPVVYTTLGELTAVFPNQ